MSVILTNGVTVLTFRDGDFNIPLVPPLRRPQVILSSSSGLSRVHEFASAQSRVIDAEVLLFRTDQGIYSGADSLMSFYESNDSTGVNGSEKTFMLTDADGVSYQVRFADDLGGGMQELKKDSHFRGSFSLLEETTLPTYETYVNSAGINTSSCHAWWAAYDMDGNGGDLSAWTTLDAVGNDAGVLPWTDKSGLGNDGRMASTYAQPKWTTGVINGRPAVDFDGGDYLHADGLIVFNNQGDYDWSVYVVVESDVPTSVGGPVNVVISAGHNSGTDEMHFIRRNVTGPPTDWEVYLNDGAGDTGTEGGGTPDASPHIISVISTGTSAVIYVDGAAQTMTGDVDTTDTMSLNSFTIGASEAAGSYGRHWQGEIGEIIVFNSFHNLLQRRRQEFRLSDMWGIDLTQ